MPFTCYDCIFEWAEGMEYGKFQNGFEYGAFGIGEILIDNTMGFVISYYTGIYNAIFYLPEVLISPRDQ